MFATFDDCLYLLDESFDYLSKLIINVKKIKYKPSNIFKIISDDFPFFERVEYKQ
jgi:hypothetical protein